MSETAKMGKGHSIRIAAKACGFVALAVLLIAFLSSLLAPSFLDSREDSVHLMYDQPEDTAELICLGASTVLCGVSPDYLFEQYGIASYNAASSQQPTVTSLYLLKDLERSQGNSVKTVIVDASQLLDDEGEDVLAERAMAVFADMGPSLVKLEYLFEVANAYDGISVQEELIPILKYHSRWSKLDSEDFGVIPYEDLGNYSHGQLIWKRTYQSNVTQKRAGKYTSKKNRRITAEQSYDRETLEAMWNEMNVHYFAELVDYCNERGIEVLLLKVPWTAWGDQRHDSVSLIADQYGIPFLDLSDPALFEECNLDYDLDYYDSKHPNMSGSRKVSEYLGKYLKAHYDFQDFRNDDRYSYMDSDLELYHQAVEDAQLMECMSLDEYLDLIDKDRYTVFLSVKGESTEGLTRETREKMAALGLKKLSELSAGDSYVGIMQNGECLTEKVSSDGTDVSLKGQYRNGSVVVKTQKLQPGAKIDDAFVLSSNGSADLGKTIIDVGDVRVIDGGDVQVIDDGDVQAINDGGVHLAEDNRGINVAVYNKVSGLLIDTASFDTSVGNARTSDLRP